MAETSLAAGLAAWVCRTSVANIPAEAIAAANVSSFDCLGVALLGSTSPIGRELTAYAEDQGGHPHCTLLGRRARASTATAALVNGAFAHAMDFDNAGGFGHPAAVLFPALLALAERHHASGNAMLEAYVIGCEVGLALYYNGGAAKSAYRQMERGLHATSMFGRIAAAAGAAKLLGLGQGQVAAALGIAASSSAGLVANFGTMTKPLHAGFAARDGVMAAELAARGVTSRLEAPGGRPGLMRSLFGERAAAPEQILTRLSRVFLTPFTYAIKRAPTCGFNSSVTESLSTLVRDGRFAAGDVEAIEIAMDDQDSEVLLYDEPTTALEAKFSVRFNAAVATLRKEQVLFDHGDDALRDPEIRAVLAKIHVRIEPAGEGKTRNGAVPVRVRLRSGEIIERATPPSEVEGATTKPLNPDRLAAKFRANAEAVLATDRVQALRATWTDLRAIDDVATAIALAGGG